MLRSLPVLRYSGTTKLQVTRTARSHYGTDHLNKAERRKVRTDKTQSERQVRSRYGEAKNPDEKRVGSDKGLARSKRWNQRVRQRPRTRSSRFICETKMLFQKGKDFFYYLGGGDAWMIQGCQTKPFGI